MYHKRLISLTVIALVVSLANCRLHADCRSGVLRTFSHCQSGYHCQSGQPEYSTCAIKPPCGSVTVSSAQNVHGRSSCESRQSLVLPSAPGCPVPSCSPIVIHSNVMGPPSWQTQSIHCEVTTVPSFAIQQSDGCECGYTVFSPATNMNVGIIQSEVPPPASATDKALQAEPSPSDNLHPASAPAPSTPAASASPAELDRESNKAANRSDQLLSGTNERPVAEAVSDAAEIAASKAEAERVESERLAAEKVAAEKVAADVKAKELEKQQLEKARIEQERIEKERIAEALAQSEKAEKDRIEKDRLEKERLEKERLEKERVDKERTEAARLANEKTAPKTIETETSEVTKNGDAKNSAASEPIPVLEATTSATVANSAKASAASASAVNVASKKTTEVDSKPEMMLTVKSIRLADKKPTGEQWDNGSDADVRLVATAAGVTIRPPDGKDKNAVILDRGLARVKVGYIVQIDVSDADLLFNDPVGSTKYTITEEDFAKKTIEVSFGNVSSLIMELSK